AHLVRTKSEGEISLIEAYHDRVRQAVVEHLGEPERSSRHGAIALALQSEADAGAELDAEQLVRHLVAAGRRGEARRYAADAARAADRTLAFDHAAGLYRLALELASSEALQEPVAPEELQSLRQGVAVALANAGRGPEAAEAFLEAATHATHGGDPLALRCRAGHQLLISGQLEDGRRVMAEVLAQVGERIPPTPLRALASLLWRRFQLWVRGLGAARRSASADPSALQRLEVLRSAAMGLGHVDHVRAADFQARSVLLALRAGGPLEVARALALETIFTALQGPAARPRVNRLIAATREAAEASGDVHAKALLKSAQGVAAYYVELRLREAADILGEVAVSFQALPGASWELANAQLLRLLALRKLGALSEVRRRAPELLRDAERRGDKFTAAMVARRLNVAWLAADLPEEAEAQLARSTWPTSARSVHFQHFYELWALGELDLYRGAATDTLARLRPRFVRQERSLLKRLSIIRTELLWLRARLALAAAIAGGADAPALLREAEEAAQRLDREGLPHLSACAGLLRASARAQQGDREGAAAGLAQAGDDATKASLGPLAAAAAWHLARLDQDEERAREAESQLEAMGAKNPARFLQLLAPGMPNRPG
ncbi:MAG: ATP-binding protein, partial [Planctomycetota bacterium]